MFPIRTFAYKLTPSINPSPSYHHLRTRTNHHREVLKEVLDIIEILQDILSLSIQEGPFKPAIQLYELQMFVEAATIGVWTVGLFRTLAGMDAATYQPYLALPLLNLARYHLDTDNLNQASLVIAECIEINQQLLLTLPTHELRNQLAQSLTTSSMIAAKIQSHCKTQKTLERHLIKYSTRFLVGTPLSRSFLIAKTYFFLVHPLLLNQKTKLSLHPWNRSMAKVWGDDSTLLPTK